MGIGNNKHFYRCLLYLGTDKRLVSEQKITSVSSEDKSRLQTAHWVQRCVSLMAEHPINNRKDIGSSPIHTSK